MSLANLVAQLESQKYSALSSGIQTAGAAISSAIIEAPMRKKRETLLDLQIEDAQRQRQKQADIDAVMKDDTLVHPLDRVKALREKGYHTEAAQYNMNEMKMRKAETEEQISSMQLGINKAAFLGKHSNAILGMPEENRADGLALMAQEFTQGMTTDPNNPVQLQDFIPKGMENPTEIANYFLRMSQDVNAYVGMKADKMAKVSFDAEIQLMYELEEYRKKGDQGMADAIRERLTAIKHDRQLANSIKEINKAKAKLDMDSKLMDEGVLGVAEEFQIDPNAMPAGTASMIADLKELLRTKTLPEAIKHIGQTYEIVDEPAKDNGFFGKALNTISFGYMATEPTFKKKKGMEESSLITNRDNELKLLMELSEKLGK